MSTMKLLRLTMIHQRQLERLAPRTQDASVAAVVDSLSSTGAHPIS